MCVFKYVSRLSRCLFIVGACMLLLLLLLCGYVCLSVVNVFVRVSVSAFSVSLCVFLVVAMLV